MLDPISPVVVTRRPSARLRIVVAVTASLVVGGVIAGIIYRGQMQIRDRELEAASRIAELETRLEQGREQFEEEIRRLHSVHAGHLERLRREADQQIDLLRGHRSPQVKALRQENRRLRDQHVAVASQLARARQQLEIDGAAYRELSKAVEDAARQIAELREEVGFYQTILSPGSDGHPVNVQRLTVEPAAQPNWYRYTLLLIQAMDSDAGVEGTVDIWIEGVQSKATLMLNVDEIGSAPDPIRFRYYQTIGGLFELPADFAPGRIRVTVEITDQNAERLERWYPWPDA